jgi:hypothetical protein
MLSERSRQKLDELRCGLDAVEIALDTNEVDAAVEERDKE